MLTAAVGINWGDEGKGRMVNLLSREYDVPHQMSVGAGREDYLVMR